MEDGPRAEGQGGEVTVGRAGLGGEIQKVKENPVSEQPHSGWAGDAGGGGWRRRPGWSSASAVCTELRG